MNGKDVVRQVMKLRGMSATVLSKKLGYATPSGVTERLRGSQDMRADTLAAFLKEMDCEIIVKSKLDDRKKWVINGESEDGDEK